MSPAGVTPEMETWLRSLIHEELRNLQSRERHVGHDPVQMKTIMARIKERRKRIGLPSDVVEEIIREHRAEVGRGPLVIDAEESDAD